MENKLVKYTIYIGSDNVTGVLDTFKGIEITSSYFKSYTYSTTSGVWNGKQEATLKLEIVTTERELIGTLVNSLKVHLRQDSIMVVEEIASNVTFV